MSHNRLCNLRTAFLATSMLTLGTAGVYAQNDSSETVVVTGSRIQTTGFQSPTPLSVIGVAQIQANANANLGDSLVELPAVVGSATPNTTQVSGNSATAGIDSVNLRGLGANRTLMLMDGRRLPEANQNGEIDVSLIPQQLISRVDVVTGGASSVYGSDAVAGVVNFVLDKNFTGLKGEISAGETNYGDGQNGKVSLTAGMNFFDNRNHLIVSGEFVRDQGVSNGNDVVQKRSWVNDGAAIIGNSNYSAAVCATTPAQCQPQLLLTTNAGYATASPGGVVMAGPLKGLAFGPGGVPYQQVYGGVVTPYMVGGDAVLNNPKAKVDLAAQETRYNVFVRDSFNVTNDVQLYAQYSMVRSFVSANGPEAVLPDTLQGPVIKLDNAYLLPQVRTQMVAAGVTSIQLGTLNYDLGQLYLAPHRVTTIYTLGGTGDVDIFGKSWNWDAYAQKGNTTTYIAMEGNISKANYALASDAVFNSNGAIVCRITLTNPSSPCKPYDVMGTGLSTNSSAGQQYIHVPSQNQTFIGQNVWGASITGETPLSLWAGPVSLAFDAEHREDKTNITVDANSLAVDHVFGNFNPLHGSTQVSEGAVEAQVPVTTADFMLGELGVSAAYRFTAYSYFGDAQTWKIGATYKPIEDITIRVTYSRDIRAPNHLEAFTPQSTTFTNLNDPATNTSPQVLELTKGNSTTLKPEIASTLGVGAVIQPRFLPGFSMSVDYWSIDLGRLIAIVPFASTLALCYNGTRPDLCANIVRTGVSQPGALPSSDVLVNITSTYENFARREMSGVDYEASYEADDLFLVPGTARLHANVTNYLQDFTQTPNVYSKDAVGTITGATRWRYSASLTYDLQPVTTTLTIRGTNGGVYNTAYVQCASACPASTANNQTINNDTMPGYFYLDLSGTYDLSNLLGVNSTAFLNIRNLENKNPPPLQANCGTLYSSCTIPNVYDALGRVYRVGLRFRT